MLLNWRRREVVDAIFWLVLGFLGRGDFEFQLYGVDEVGMLKEKIARDERAITDDRGRGF